MATRNDYVEQSHKNYWLDLTLRAENILCHAAQRTSREIFLDHRSANDGDSDTGNDGTGFLPKVDAQLLAAAAGEPGSPGSLFVRAWLLERRGHSCDELMPRAYVSRRLCPILGGSRTRGR